MPQVAPVDLPRFGDADPLVRNLDLGSVRVETSHAAMKIPAGWTAILPEAVHTKCAYATYDQTYRFEKGTVYTERKHRRSAGEGAEQRLEGVQEMGG